MIKIGKICTVASIIPKAYEVIEIEGGMFAGNDAFLFPNNREDLRCLECLAIPGEWRGRNAMWKGTFPPASLPFQRANTVRFTVFLPVK